MIFFLAGDINCELAHNISSSNLMQTPYHDASLIVIFPLLTLGFPLPAHLVAGILGKSVAGQVGKQNCGM